LVNALADFASFLGTHVLAIERGCAFSAESATFVVAKRHDGGGTIDLDGETMSVTGSCLCGGVRYEVADGGFGRVVNCHCSMCRKATGAAFRTRASVRPAAFRWLAGEELVSRYQSSPGEARTFCRVCGATLATFLGDKEIGLPLGTLDDDPVVRPAAHLFVNSKAAWFEIADGLPQFGEGIVGRDP
jgi:hypothetical protein